MFKPKLPLRLFAAAIAQSVNNANELLELDHRDAVQRYITDQMGVLLPPPPPLMIQNVRVKFKGNVSKGDQDKAGGELLIDLNRPHGNFSAELEFTPFSEEMLKAAGNKDNDENAYFPETGGLYPIPPMAPASMTPESPAPMPDPLLNTYDQGSTSRGDGFSL